MLRHLVIPLLLLTLAACTMSGSSSRMVTGLNPQEGTYSSYGGDIEYDAALKLHYIDVFVGGGGNETGAIRYARPKIDEYATKNKLGAGTVTRSEYSFFPLSKFRIYILYD